ncbi:hypothetical protein [Thermococcus gorgonarius]|uniref:KaiC-like domain-containing protein n=1 Tax=Thermococcus gorgonarius TaxID=71997 RepID=A0A2Z2M912_THEGO|nr:hypothetical protein [Thermococcus gorgonarius]ASJ00975.1 hypothetical protein A3K92_05520 [Thermococcus gorgonarius]
MVPVNVEKIEDLFKTITPGTTVSFIYETYSMSWELPLVLIKYHIENGNAAVISNYSRPVGHLFRDLKILGMNVKEVIKEDRLFIIDVFGSRHRIIEGGKNIFYLDSVEPETLNPKIWRIYEENIIPRIKDKWLLRVIYPLHGVVHFAGEEPTIKIMSQVIAKYSLNLPNSTMVLVFNRDTVSKNFTAWTVELSDYVFLSKVFLGKGAIEEHLYFLKAPVPGFKPKEYRLIKTGKRGSGMFRIKKVGESSPELRPPADEKR